ncbi:hypothetical protein H4S08_004462 [Coemansia sp. RSA 1365]|nr:hypothetical protein H4S08_004462 [Coemansia sp. RSA 1365]
MPATAHAVSQTIKNAYKDMLDAQPMQELLHPSLTETRSSALPVMEPIVSCPMRACLELLANNFVPERDDKFIRLNMMYPGATKASVNEQLHYQCETELHADALLRELMREKDAVWEYPGRCPLPAAFAPIQPPMHGQAKTVYVVQHMLSKVTCAARDEVVATRLQNGINKPSQAFVQLQIFTIANINTTEWRVLFENSAINSLNMISVGMQLPMLIEWALLLCDAQIILFVDMASFFTQLWLSADVADYWTYDGGPQGKLCNWHMVQGNSKSPAIVHAFILHVLDGVTGLCDHLLAYIDYIYIKSTDNDMEAHIADIETDCGTVVSLFLHKATSDADSLAQFKLGFTKLGVKKHMIVHRCSINQQIADWLLQAKECICPDKLPAGNSIDMADATIGAHDTTYTMGMLSIDDKDNYSTDKEITPPPLALTPSIEDAIDPMAVDSRPTPPTGEQQYGTIIRALDVPCPSDFTNCQTDDDKIQW